MNEVLPLPDDRMYESEADGVGAKGMVESYVVPIYRHRFMVLTFAVLGFCGGVLAGAFQANEYTSVGKLLLRGGVREGMRLDQAATPDARPGLSNLMENELHLLRSEEIYEKVAKTISSDRILAPYDPAGRYGDPGTSPMSYMHRLQSWYFDRQAGALESATDEEREFVAKERLQSAERTSVKAAPRSNVLIVEHTSNDPVLSRDIVDALLAEYQERHREKYAATRAVEVLEAQEERARTDVERAEGELRSALGELGVENFEVERSKLLESQFDLEGQVADLELEVVNENRRLARARARADDYEIPTEPEIMKVEIDNPDHVEKEKDLERLEDEMQSLRLIHREGTTPIVRQQEQIDAVRAELETIEPRVIETRIIEPSLSEFRRLEAEVLTREENLEDLRARLADRTKRLAAARKRLDHLGASAPRIDRLKRQLLTYSTTSNHTARSLQEARNLAELDEAKISNLEVLDWGSLPDGKSGPDRKKILAMGLFAGLAAGMALAFGRSLLDRRIHIAAELERAAGAPVIAVIRQRSALARRKG